MKKSAWIYKVFLWTFLLSVVFSAITSLIAYNANQMIIFFVIILVMIIGIVFDMVGASALTSKEASFHAMSAKKIKGAKDTIVLIKNSAKVSNFCNDLVGDVCGVISGGLGTVFAINLASTTNFSLAYTSILVAAFISSFTVSGKALFKEVAIKNSDNIIFMVGKLKSFLKLK